jgi:TPP-dependent pyruvate/acetoin dehydrogenase alpha subunit
MAQAERSIELFRLMAFSRAFDEVIGSHDGHWHGLEGEEAAAVGVYASLEEGDVLAPHYRGSPLASYIRGADLTRLMAGMFGKPSGYNKGRHRNDVCGPWEHKLIGLYSGSLGPPVSYATGAALAMKLDGRDRVATAVFGDGVSSRGDIHEAMNLASVKQLPMIFVCQNNQYAISTAAGSGVAGEVYRRAEGYAMPGRQLDGNSIDEVREAMEDAIRRARGGGGPTLLELKTYRVAGHFYSDQEDYRDPDEVTKWRERDPIASYRDSLVESGTADHETLDRIGREVREEIQDAFEAARAAPEPGPDELDPHRVYASAVGRPS